MWGTPPFSPARSMAASGNGSSLQVCEKNLAYKIITSDFLWLRDFTVSRYLTFMRTRNRRGDSSLIIVILLGCLCKLKV